MPKGILQTYKRVFTDGNTERAWPEVVWHTPESTRPTGAKRRARVQEPEPAPKQNTVRKGAIGTHCAGPCVLRAHTNTPEAQWRALGTHGEGDFSSCTTVPTFVYQIRITQHAENHVTSLCVNST